MTLSFTLPVVCGILLAFGQLYMKKLAAAIPPDLDLASLTRAALTSFYFYTFIAVNLAATVVYVAALRYLTMTTTFAIVFVTMGATVLCLDLIVNRINLSTINLVGLVLGVIGVLLIASR